MATTVHNDKIGGHLASALMLLEMAMDEHAHSRKSAHVMPFVCFAHSYMQAARSNYINGPDAEDAPVMKEARELVAGLIAQEAIDYAKGE